MAYSVVQSVSATTPNTDAGTTGTFGAAPTVNNHIIAIVEIDRYDGTPATDAAPTVSRSGAETFTRLGWSSSTNQSGRQYHIFAALITSTATTAVSIVETVGANCDFYLCYAFEVSGLAAIGSMFLANSSTRHSYPGTGSSGSGLFGTLSGQPAMCLALWTLVSEATLAVDTGYTQIGSLQLAHRRLTSTASTQGTVNCTVDGQFLVYGAALLESSQLQAARSMHQHRLRRT
jgi:hypothetical protein